MLNIDFSCATTGVCSAGAREISQTRSVWGWQTEGRVPKGRRKDHAHETRAISGVLSGRERHLPMLQPLRGWLISGCPLRDKLVGARCVALCRINTDHAGGRTALLPCCSVEKMLACGIRMELGWELGSATVSVAAPGVSPGASGSFSVRRDAERGTRDACAPQTATFVEFMAPRLKNVFYKATALSAQFRLAPMLGDGRAAARPYQKWGAGSPASRWASHRMRLIYPQINPLSGPRGNTILLCLFSAGKFPDSPRKGYLI